MSKMPTCDCHKQYIPDGAGLELITADIGFYTVIVEAKYKTDGNMIELEKITTYNRLVLPLSFCPACGAQYKEEGEQK